MDDSVKKLFQELLTNYVDDFLDDPKSFVNSPKEMKDEIALLIKAGRVIGVDVAVRFNPPAEEKASGPKG